MLSKVTNMKKMFFAAFVLALSFVCYFMFRVVPVGIVDAETFIRDNPQSRIVFEQDALEIERPRYLIPRQFRIWGGIAPWQWRLRKDPHFSANTIDERLIVFPDGKRLLRSQGMSINGAFSQTGLNELILAIQVGSKITEYAIDDIGYWLRFTVDTRPWILGMYENKVVVLLETTRVGFTEGEWDPALIVLETPFIGDSYEVIYKGQTDKWRSALNQLASEQIASGLIGDLCDVSNTMLWSIVRALGDRCLRDVSD